MKNFILLTLSASVLASSLAARGEGESCRDAFLIHREHTIQSTKVLTVREHFKNLGVLKAESEIERFNQEDKVLYLSLLDLELSRAQEIMKLLATFPILTSPKVRGLFSKARKLSSKRLSQYLAETRFRERSDIAFTLASALVTDLGLQDQSRNYIMTQNFADLDSTDKVREYNSQLKVVQSYGIPGTMIREIGQFFHQIQPTSGEFKFIQSLIHKNFDNIARASEPVNWRIIKFVENTQLISISSSTSLGVFFGSGVIFSGSGVDWVLGAAGGFFSAMLIGDTPKSLISLRDNLSLANLLKKANAALSSRKEATKIKHALLMLSALDPNSIKSLPNVQQIKNDSNPKSPWSVRPALQDPNLLAYPDVDLSKLENSIESKISLKSIENLQPTFDDIDKLSKNPFSLLSYGVELGQPQFLIIGREVVMAARFKELTERMTEWQKKRDQAKTEKENAWILDEKTRLLDLLNIHAKENSSSWEYLQALRLAVQRFDQYLIDVLRPRAGDSLRQVDSSHENFRVTIDQIKEQIESLKIRAESIEQLMAALRA